MVCRVCLKYLWFSKIPLGIYAELRNGKQKMGVGLQGWDGVGWGVHTELQSENDHKWRGQTEGKRIGRGSTREVVINTKLLLLTESQSPFIMT